MKKVYSQIYVKCKAIKEDREALTMNKVRPANLFLQALTCFFTIASAMVIYVSKLPLSACSIWACSISKLRKWIRC